MNKKQILMSKAGTSLEELPVDIKEKLEKDPKVLEQFQEQARVASLMKLKNYEEQDPAMEGRVLHRVGVRIRNGEHLKRESALEIFPDWARMVAVVLVMLGLSFMTHREMLETPESSSDLPSLANAEEVVPLPNLSEPPKLSVDPFSPSYVVFDDEETPNLMTPEFSRQLESSIMELGLDLTNRTQSVNTMPVLYRP